MSRIFPKYKSVAQVYFLLYLWGCYASLSSSNLDYHWIRNPTLKIILCIDSTSISIKSTTSVEYTNIAKIHNVILQARSGGFSDASVIKAG